MTTRKMCLAAATALALASTTSAEAQQNCGPRNVVVERLQGHYGEARQSIGMATQGRVVEVFASTETRTWTITVTLPNGMTCLVASGQAFEILTDGPAPEGTPS